MPPKTKTQKIILVANIATKKYKKFTLNELSTELKRLNELEKKQTMPANVIRINVIKELVEESKLCKNQPKTIPPFKSKKMKKENEVRPVDKTVTQLKSKRIINIRQIDKNNKRTNEDKVPLDKFINKIKEILDNRGYKPLSKNQNEEIGFILSYLEGNKGIKNYNIKESKGKTGMLILNHESYGSDQDRLFSLRVKKK